ncbi:hypothetical protein [Ciceribacter sp. L1K22]|uniref:hypothetical protein n=1 Tax=Ciceribacter sp. L1K22 TaxID=2820275 RepID=UPI001ABE1821|nr:hypothetical protein [Ciceribacter sp. L1K22]MBO3760787.1 hypothetical protein [Ciceribacter sp. L1K22]
MKDDIDAGLRLLELLDRAGFGVTAAFWLYDSDQERWRFVVAARDAERDLGQKYLDAAGIISKARESGLPDLLPLDRVRITSSSDPLVAGLTQVLRVPGTTSARFSRSMVNGIYVEDALIHRLAA